MLTAEFQPRFSAGPTQPCALRDGSVSPPQALCWSLSQVKATTILPTTPQRPELYIAANISFGRIERGWKEVAFCPALEDAKSEQSWGRHRGGRRGRGNQWKLLPVLSVAIAALQCPRDIWHLVLNRRFFPYIIRCKNSWGTQDFDHMTHNTFLPFKQNRTKLQGFKKRVLKATFPLRKKLKIQTKENPGHFYPPSTLLVFCFAVTPVSTFANWQINSQIKRFTAEPITVLQE